MESELVSGAMAAVTSLAVALDLRVNDVVVIHDSNKLLYVCCHVTSSRE